MLSCISLRRLAPLLVAASVVALGVTGCASDPATETDEGAVQDVSSTLPIGALPLAAVSMTGANFAGLGIGAASTLGAGTALGAPGIGGTLGTTTTIGGSPLGFSTNLGTGPISTGTSFNSGPMGFSTGPIGFNSSFGTGPISTGNSMSISSANGGMPVIHSTCTGIVCP